MNGPWSPDSRHDENTRLCAISSPPPNPSLALMPARGPLKNTLPLMTLRAVEPLGWMHNPPWSSLDFGVEDSGRPAGMTHDRSSWWDTRANPLDYFTPALRRQVLARLEPHFGPDTGTVA